MMLICKKTMRELNESAAQAPDTDGGASTIGARTPVAADPVAYFASREWGGGIIWEQMQKAYKDAPEVIPLYRHPDPRIAALERDLAAAQESYRNCVKDYNTVVDDNTQLRVDLAAANTRADAMLRVAQKHEAEAAALRVDAKRYRWLRTHYGLHMLPEAKRNLLALVQEKGLNYRGAGMALDVAIDAAR